MGVQGVEHTQYRGSLWGVEHTQYRGESVGGRAYAVQGGVRGGTDNITVSNGQELLMNVSVVKLENPK